VKQDMQKPIPMDRLICGDVGFGKTEIAVRAAFKAVQDGKQVVVLAPTTLLVQQHYETFTNRFSGFPITVAAMSRFQSEKEVNNTIQGLESGEVDVVIGTHKLLNPNIKFKDLGLVIIDEEQRFGVEHKETLKALRTNVDVLSLSATPIPRTLEMAVTGIREMSTLATPPEDRLPVLTYVGAYEDAQVAACVKRELLRGGQVFYVHNRVEDISKVATNIQKLVPDARVAIAHGKMGEKQLDTIIRDFWHRDIDVLVCTTIIETGLDISNANTLIVDHADRFGLSQLHQLRGRVGRGRERAYAYFLYDPSKPMTQQAHDRLATIAQYTALGSGFDVAMKDLELRGTGNLLGNAQSGHIEGVGFDLYVRMVCEAVEKYKEPEHKETVSTSIDLPVEASIPVDYIDSDKLRLEAYRKLASANNNKDLQELRDELLDRFGEPPEAFSILCDVARLRFKARDLGITQISSQGKSVRVIGLDPKESLWMRLQRIYRGVKYRPLTHTLIIPSPFESSLGTSAMSEREILDWVRQLLEDLAW
ncbi:transcription-repair coupling factor, partial [Bifidobacteriaceae bacterium VN002]